VFGVIVATAWTIFVEYVSPFLIFCARTAECFRSFPTKLRAHEGRFGVLVVIIVIIRSNGKHKESQEGDGISRFEAVNRASNRPIFAHISMLS